jgi:hypothetical protein
MSNTKIKNATPTKFNGIEFKSKLEVNVYKTLLIAGFKPNYEKLKFTLWEGYKPTVPFYTKSKKTRELELDDTKIRGITYTPDFTFNYKDYLIVVEVKGKENDVYPYKRKLFRKWLEINHPKSMFFEVFSKKNTETAIKIIKSL